MAAERNDGGSAFPETWHEAMGYSPAQCGQGMTLRDYFAAKAMQGQIAALADERARQMSCANADEAGVTPKEQVGIAAYEYADAMLKARGL